MTSTVAELARDVLSIRLGIVDIKKSPTAELLARVARLYNQRYSELAMKDKAYWPQYEIPDEIVGAISRIIAEEMAPGLGMPPPTEPDDNGRGQPVSMGTKGWRMLNRMISAAGTGRDIRKEYF